MSKAVPPKRAQKQPPLKRPAHATLEASSQVHVFGNGFVCETDSRGFATPRGRSLTELVLDASEGFIPLWAPETTLRWRFRSASLRERAHPDATMREIRGLLAEAVLAWGDAAPVKFAERADAWDFEIDVRNADNCTAGGCVLASAFFPDAGRHELRIYPHMFSQSRQEQVDTMTHEIGHVFGLRHFFAQISEQRWRSEIFGAHEPFSIMNYGLNSTLTQADRDDLRRLYQLVWSGRLTHVNGTPIRLVRPFHTAEASTVGMNQVQPAPMPLPRVAQATRLQAGCLDLVSAGEVVQNAIPGGPHDIDSTLEEAGLISDALRTLFQANVVSGVVGRGCQIAPGDIPTDADATLREVRKAVRDNARS